MTRNLFKLLLLCIGLPAAAQTKNFTYDGSVAAGLLEGESGSAFQLQTINGVAYKTWSAGVGAGLDYYHSRSIPLFLAVRKSFGTSVKAPFLYAHGGYNFPWLRNVEKEWGYANAIGGLYADAGIGYQVPVLKKSALYFSAGYSQKNYSVEYAYPVYIDIYPAPPSATYKTDNRLRRLSIRMGLRF
jgi:hypothetical protein